MTAVVWEIAAELDRQRIPSQSRDAVWLDVPTTQLRGEGARADNVWLRECLERLTGIKVSGEHRGDPWGAVILAEWHIAQGGSMTHLLIPPAALAVLRSPGNFAKIEAAAAHTLTGHAQAPVRAPGRQEAPRTAQLDLPPGRAARPHGRPGSQGLQALQQLPAGRPRARAQGHRRPRHGGGPHDPAEARPRRPRCPLRLALEGPARRRRARGRGGARSPSGRGGNARPGRARTGSPSPIPRWSWPGGTASASGTVRPGVARSAGPSTPPQAPSRAANATSRLMPGSATGGPCTPKAPRGRQTSSSGPGRARGASGGGAGAGLEGSALAASRARSSCIRSTAARKRPNAGRGSAGRHRGSHRHRPLRMRPPGRRREQARRRRLHRPRPPRRLQHRLGRRLELRTLDLQPLRQPGPPRLVLGRPRPSHPRVRPQADLVAAHPERFPRGRLHRLAPRRQRLAHPQLRRFQPLLGVFRDRTRLRGGRRGRRGRSPRRLGRRSGRCHLHRGRQRQCRRRRRHLHPHRQRQRDRRRTPLRRPGGLR